jgi:uncharacterized protein YlbG (UPF0298 family)
VFIEMTAEKNKYMLMFCQQNARQSQNIKKLRSFENVKYLGTTLTNQDDS